MALGPEERAGGWGHVAEPHVDLWFFISSWLSSPRGLTVKMRQVGRPTCR